MVILGSGPNRIGQGVEFDYCCVQASFALHDAGFETVMVNCNPETVSTDYDTSDRLYFEPVTREDVQNVLDVESADGHLAGVIVALGGQTPLKLSSAIPPELVMGTSPASIDLAEDRERWNALCERLGIPQAAGGHRHRAGRGAWPSPPRWVTRSWCGPATCWGDGPWRSPTDEDDLERAMSAMTASGSLGREGGLSAERPVLVDKFLEDAIEVDVDAVRDGTGETLIGAVMEHVEEAGVHSGDSACVVPPPTLGAETVEVIERPHPGDSRCARGERPAQCAVRRSSSGHANGSSQVFVIEANPRASRTVPFVSKATGVPLAKVAARVMAGATLAELRSEGLLRPPVEGYVSVKEAVLPFDRFPGADSLLGPEMRSTGEVMGIDATFGLAFSKSQLAAGDNLAEGGTVFFSVADRDKPRRPGSGRPLRGRRASRSPPPPGRRSTWKRPGCRWRRSWPR